MCDVRHSEKDYNLKLLRLISSAVYINQVSSLYPTTKICRVGLYTELFYAIIPTLFLCILLICYPYIFLHF